NVSAGAVLALITCLSLHRLSLSTFFFLLLLRPPRPTLFPYTTLFRSQPGGVDVSGPGEVDDELARATVEGVQHFLLHVLAVPDDQLSVHADHHDATLVLRQTEGHLRSPA